MSGYKTFKEMVIAEGLTRDDILSYVSDTYKEIHGVRPRWIYNDSTKDLCEMAESLGREADEHYKRGGSQG